MMAYGLETVSLPDGARGMTNEAIEKMLFSPRVTPVLTVAGSDSPGAPIGANTGDMFVNKEGITSVWNGAGWDGVGGFRELAFASGAAAESLKNFSQIWEGPEWGVVLGGHAACPYCGTLNPPDVAECGAGRWNGCGAPLGVQ